MYTEEKWRQEWLLPSVRVTTADHWRQTISHSQPQQGALKSTVISVTLLLLLMLMLNNNNNNNNNNILYMHYLRETS
jgi:hypothetical protein